MSGFSFDESEFAPVGPEDEPAYTDAVDGVVAELQDPVPDLDTLDQEVESRFETALYYRALLKDSLFDKPSAAAKTVETEVRAFIRDRLETLLGMKQAPKPQPQQLFSDEEMAALKAVAAKLLGKPNLLESKPTPPSVRKAQAPAPAPKTKVAASVPAITPKKVDGATPRKPKVEVIPNKGEWTDADVGKFVVENGVKYKLVKNELGTIYRKDVTERKIPANAIPLPMGKQAVEATFAAQAAQQIQMLVNQPLFK